MIYDRSSGDSSGEANSRVRRFPFRGAWFSHTKWLACVNGWRLDRLGWKPQDFRDDDDDNDDDDGDNDDDDDPRWWWLKWKSVQGWMWRHPFLSLSPSRFGTCRPWTCRRANEERRRRSLAHDRVDSRRGGLTSRTAGYLMPAGHGERGDGFFRWRNYFHFLRHRDGSAPRAESVGQCKHVYALETQPLVSQPELIATLNRSAVENAKSVT